MQKYLQLSISSVQFCSSSGYLRRSIIQAAVVVILGRKKKSLLMRLISIFLWLHTVERTKYIPTDTCLFLLKYCVCWLLVTNAVPKRLCHSGGQADKSPLHSHYHCTASVNNQQSVYPEKKSPWIRIALLLPFYTEEAQKRKS